MKREVSSCEEELSGSYYSSGGHLERELSCLNARSVEFQRLGVNDCHSRPSDRQNIQSNPHTFH
jgi:hypothetical protein